VFKPKRRALKPIAYLASNAVGYLPHSLLWSIATTNDNSICGINLNAEHNGNCAVVARNPARGFRPLFFAEGLSEAKLLSVDVQRVQPEGNGLLQ
jgi:hypothetical protein